MAQLYRNYPEGMKDHEIIECVKEYTNEIIKSGAQVNTVWQFTPLIQLGQYELEKRQSKRITLITTGISVVSILVAAVALWIAVDNSRASERWEKSQLQILEQIKTKLVEAPVTTANEKETKTIEKPANKLLNQTGANNAPPG